jgi:putative redox protein
LHPKSFVSLDKADHLMSREADSKYAGQVLASWASRYLLSATASKESPLAAAEGFVVAQTKIDGFRTEVSAGNHAFLADEPLSVGGTDTGPTPYDLLSAALATCTSITLRMYARLKNIELRSATVAVRHGRVHAEDCGDCESATGKIDEFQRVLTLDGDLTEEQRQRMLEIADRCPVHKTLHGEIKVRTTLTGQ